jgi:hypothetical protein
MSVDNLPTISTNASASVLAERIEQLAHEGLLPIMSHRLHERIIRNDMLEDMRRLDNARY